MKCPKCSYLGFETGDRCKNCGYDFSLLADSTSSMPDPDLRIRQDDSPVTLPDVWLNRLDQSFGELSPPLGDASSPVVSEQALAPPPAPGPAAPAPPLPLFKTTEPDDAPMIAVPAAPRAPLSVRRTPDTPRLRALPRVARPAEPALEFTEDPAVALIRDVDHQDPMPPPASAGTIDGPRDVGGRRLVAGAIDHTLLLAIDAAVVYFTLRMAGLTTADLTVLPPVPLLTFLLLLKAAYFIAFTVVGGQTIGKMAAGIRVVGERGGIDGGLAVRRTFATLLSLLPFGLGMLPAFFGDHRALHDRLTGTRVVGLPTA